MSYELVGLSIAIFTHAGASIWWASKITTVLDNQTNEFMRLNRELEKRDEQISAIWQRVDKLRDLIGAK